VRRGGLRRVAGRYMFSSSTHFLNALSDCLPFSSRTVSKARGRLQAGDAGSACALRIVLFLRLGPHVSGVGTF
ncbi:MAG: hypothetical protein ACI4L8_10170, partial [Candidatus Fimadaptatus sp.]